MLMLKKVYLFFIAILLFLLNLSNSYSQNKQVANFKFIKKSIVKMVMLTPIVQIEARNKEIKKIDKSLADKLSNRIVVKANEN